MSKNLIYSSVFPKSSAKAFLELTGLNRLVTKSLLGGSMFPPCNVNITSRASFTSTHWSYVKMESHLCSTRERQNKEVEDLF